MLLCPNTLHDFHPIFKLFCQNNSPKIFLLKQHTKTLTKRALLNTNVVQLACNFKSRTVMMFCCCALIISHPYPQQTPIATIFICLGRFEHRFPCCIYLTKTVIVCLSISPSKTLHVLLMIVLLKCGFLLWRSSDCLKNGKCCQIEHQADRVSPGSHVSRGAVGK